MDSKINYEVSKLNKIYIIFVSTGFDLNREAYFGLINELNLI
jgi:hypothetical protein